MKPAFPFLLLILLLAGCGSRVTLSFPESGDLPFRSVLAVEPDSGRTLTHREFLQRLDESEVILVGEPYASESSNLVEQLLLITMLEQFEELALSLEMLSRDKQHHVDAWLAGDLPTADFVDAIGVADWGGEGGWMAYYQALLDWARMAGWPVVASNAPERVIRVAWERGMPGLEILGQGDAARYFELPQSTEVDALWARFLLAMEGEENVEEEELEAMFLAQRVWDATMAGSIVDALARHKRALHVTGRFHVEHQGGTVKELEARRPDIRMLVLSIAEPGTDRAHLEPGVADLVLIPTY